MRLSLTPCSSVTCQPIIWSSRRHSSVGLQKQLYREKKERERKYSLLLLRIEYERQFYKKNKSKENRATAQYSHIMWTMTFSLSFHGISVWRCQYVQWLRLSNLVLYWLRPQRHRPFLIWTGAQPFCNAFFGTPTSGLKAAVSCHLCNNWVSECDTVTGVEYTRWQHSAVQGLEVGCTILP